MKIERTDKETIIRIPASIDVVAIQKVINYLTAMEIGQQSKAKQKDIDALAKAAKKGSWFLKNRKRLGL